MIPPRDVTLVVDETVDQEGSNFAALCVAEVDDPIGASALIDGLRASLLRDPYFIQIPSVRGSLQEVGFHYCQDAPDVRLRMLTALQAIRFEAYIAFRSDRPVDTQYSWYDDLLSVVVPDRLAANRHNRCQLLLEEHGKRGARQAALSALLGRWIDGVEEKAGARLYAPPQLSLESKARSELAIADYVVGCFRQYWLKGRHKPESLEARQFGEIWSRVRVVVDVGSGHRYSRHNPLPGFA